MAKSPVTPHTEFKDLPQVLTVPEVAAHLRVSRQHIYKMLTAQAKKLASFKVNGAIRIKKDALGRYLGNS